MVNLYNQNGPEMFISGPLLHNFKKEKNNYGE